MVLATRADLFENQEVSLAWLTSTDLKIATAAHYTWKRLVKKTEDIEPYISTTQSIVPLTVKLSAAQRQGVAQSIRCDKRR
jgi:hypothetical protein